MRAVLINNASSWRSVGLYGLHASFVYGPIASSYKIGFRFQFTVCGQLAGWAVRRRYSWGLSWEVGDVCIETLFRVKILKPVDGSGVMHALYTARVSFRQRTTLVCYVPCNVWDYIMGRLLTRSKPVSYIIVVSISSPSSSEAAEECRPKLRWRWRNCRDARWNVSLNIYKCHLYRYTKLVGDTL